MGAPATPTPEAGAFRVLYRDERNISRAFGWASSDDRFLGHDDGLLLVAAPMKKVQRLKSGLVIRIDDEDVPRMIKWWLHCLDATGERSGPELQRLLRLGQPRRGKGIPPEGIRDRGSPYPDPNDDEFLRRLPYVPKRV